MLTRWALSEIPRGQPSWKRVCTTPSMREESCTWGPPSGISVFIIIIIIYYFINPFDILILYIDITIHFKPFYFFSSSSRLLTWSKSFFADCRYYYQTTFKTTAHNNYPNTMVWILRMFWIGLGFWKNLALNFHASSAIYWAVIFDHPYYIPPTLNF